MDCSGKADCNCRDCEYDDDSDDVSLPKILKELPKGAIPVNQFYQPRRLNGPLPPRPMNYIQDQVLTIPTPIYPLTNIIGLDSGLENKISINFLRNGRMVVFSWESFRGQIGATKVGNLSLSTALVFKPLHSLNIPIQIELNGIGQTALITINPKEPTEQVKIYFSNSSQKLAQFGDIIHVFGNSITYITHEHC